MAAGIVDGFEIAHVHHERRSEPSAERLQARSLVIRAPVSAS
jgi:hypothetical protein